MILLLSILRETGVTGCKVPSGDTSREAWPVRAGDSHARVWFEGGFSLVTASCGLKPSVARLGGTIATSGRGDPRGRGQQHREVGGSLRGVHPRMNVGNTAEAQPKGAHPAARRAGGVRGRHVGPRNPMLPRGV